MAAGHTECTSGAQCTLPMFSFVSRSAQFLVSRSSCCSNAIVAVMLENMFHITGSCAAQKAHRNSARNLAVVRP